MKCSGFDVCDVVVRTANDGIRQCEAGEGRMPGLAMFLMLVINLARDAEAGDERMCTAYGLKDGSDRSRVVTLGMGDIG